MWGGRISVLPLALVPFSFIPQGLGSYSTLPDMFFEFRITLWLGMARPLAVGLAGAFSCEWVLFALRFLLHTLVDASLRQHVFPFGGKMF